MTRNEIIEEVDRLCHALMATYPEFGERDSLMRQKWVLVGECERFGNDLCNAATAHNRRLGVMVYTVREGQVKLGELARAIRPWVFERLIEESRRAE